MHLYIYSEFSKEIANITLRHGCCPCIGDQSSEQLEPAIWFKVLVLDAISINCNKRTVMWHTSTDLQSIHSEDDVLSKAVDGGLVKGGDSATDHKLAKMLGHRRSSSRRIVRREISDSVYAGGECMGYESDMDLVFDLAQDMLSQFACGDISQADFNKAIFRILHIHILPKIRLSADDVINVQDAAAIVDGYINDIDELILDKQNKIDRVQEDGKKLRDKFINEMSQPDFSCTFSLTMAECLHEQVNNDLVAAQQQLEKITQEVGAVKEVILSSGDSEDSSSISSSGEEDLSRLRQRRDKFLNDRFNKLLTARAVLDDYIRSSAVDDIGGSQKPSRKSKAAKKKSKKSRKKSKIYAPTDEENPLHATYMGMEQTNHHLVCEIQELAHKKVLQTSVKEAIRGVLQVLLGGEETAGVDIDPTGTKCPTDVMRHSRIPLEWLSLAEQVATVLQDNNLTLSQAHVLFCDKVREMCIVALQKRKLSNLSVSIEQESGPPTLSPTHNGGFYAENKLYNLKHGIKPLKSPVSRDSERSSGFSSHCPSESDASRASNLTNRSCSYLTRESLQPKPEHLTEGTSPEVNASLPENCHELQLPSEVMLRSTGASGKFTRSASEPTSLANNNRPDAVDAHGSGSLLFERSMDSATVDATDHSETIAEYAILETSDVALIEATDELEVGIEKLRVYVTSQFEEICIQLQDHLGFTGDVYYKKIWQCYETHFFGDTMGLICQLYVEAYAVKLKNFLDNLLSLTAADLDLNGFIINALVDVESKFKLKDIPEHPQNKRESDASQLTGSSDCQSSPSGTLSTEGTVTPSEHTLTASDDSAGPMPGTENCTLVRDEKLHHGSWDVIPDSEVTPDPLTNDKLSVVFTRLSNSSPTSTSVHGVVTFENLIKSQTRTLPESMRLDLTPGYTSRATNSLGRNSTLEPPQNDLRKEIKSSSSSLENNSSTCTSSEGTRSMSSSEPTTSQSSSEQSLDANPEVLDLEEKPRIIRVSHPTMKNILCDRHTRPSVLRDPLAEYNFVHEVPPTIHLEGSSAEGVNSHQVVPVSPTAIARDKTTQFQKDVREQFQEAFATIDQALKDNSPLHKLQQLVKCLKEINRQYQRLQLELCGEHSFGACTDELIDILVLFLCNCNMDVAQKLYAQIMMLSHFLPRFFEGGPFSFTLVQFSAGFQVLQDRLLFKSQKAASESEA